MASKRNERRKGCDGKERLTKEAAKQKAWHLRRRGGEAMDVYRCRFCHHWHVGHRITIVRKNIANRSKRA